MPAPTDRLVIGTAGHIDHGKSTLVRTLTGVDPDRLKEEKERGITIVLGFAPLDLPSGRRCGVVDVPGHERLVRTMIAGATGVDILLLVVAADEGVMPQTREHLAICQLLGVSHGVVALTKADLVEEEWLELVTSDLEGELAGTFLGKAPIVPCSSKSGAGLDALLRALDQAADDARARDPDGLMRMAVDRVFTIKGFGTVITGTLLSGRVRVGDTVELLPTGTRGRVRGLEVHGEAVEDSVAGVRTAVNIQGAEGEEVHRGDWLVHPGALEPSRRIDARLSLLAVFPRALRNRSKVVVHAGTTYAEATVRLLEVETLEPGRTALAHLELAAPLVVLPGDRLILRGTERLANHGHTIGGAVVVRPLARRPRKSAETAAEVEALEAATEPAERLALVTRQAGPAGVEGKALLPLSGVGPQAARKALKELTKQGVLVAFGQDGVVHASRLEELLGRARERIATFHEERPLEAAMPREELRSKLPGVSPALFGVVVNRLGHDPSIVVEADSVRLATFKPTASVQTGDVEQLKARIMEQLEAGGLTPPRDKELAESLGVDLAELKGALKLLLGDGAAVKVTENLYFARAPMARLEEAVVAHLKAHGELNAQDWKAITGASRKFAIPLGEYFDKKKVTMRVGEVRVLRGRREHET